jgi:hypothetical protein
MYESPISITERLLDEYAKMVIERRDNEILAKVQSVVGVDVDKGELLRALQYDRDQYEKGYADGKRDAMDELVRCEQCRYYNDTEKRCDHPCLDFEVECYDHWLDMESGDFCSYGERREGE